MDETIAVLKASEDRSAEVGALWKWKKCLIGVGLVLALALVVVGGSTGMGMHARMATLQTARIKLLCTLTTYTHTRARHGSLSQYQTGKGGKKAKPQPPAAEKKSLKFTGKKDSSINSPAPGAEPCT